MTTGPDPDGIARYILEAYPDTAVASAGGGTFFSCDAEANWPNFATLVTTDEFDTASDLSRPGVFRLNIGLSRETFDRLVGGARDVDFTALDTLIPHPVYARQHWVSVLNPSRETFEKLVSPLLDEAHARVASHHAKKQDREALRGRDA